MKCTRISPDGVFAADQDGNEIFYQADTVVLAMGMCSRSRDVELLRKLVKEFYVIGDARKPGKVTEAVRDAYDAVTTLGLY